MSGIILRGRSLGGPPGLHGRRGSTVEDRIHGGGHPEGVRAGEAHGTGEGGRRGRGSETGTASDIGWIHAGSLKVGIFWADTGSNFFILNFKLFFLRRRNSLKILKSPCEPHAIGAITDDTIESLPGVPEAYALVPIPHKIHKAASLLDQDFSAEEEVVKLRKKTTLPNLTIKH